MRFFALRVPSCGCLDPGDARGEERLVDGHSCDCRSADNVRSRVRAAGSKGAGAVRTPAIARVAVSPQAALAGRRSEAPGEPAPSTRRSPETTA
jgi:hypothetical protein